MRNYIGETTPPATGSDIDWSAILSGALNFGQAYFNSRQKPPGTPPPPPPAPTGMSQTTKALLIGGGVLAAGLLVYAITKKK
jgi:LPXTG-motif cell wall-anchored protein